MYIVKNDNLKKSWDVSRGGFFCFCLFRGFLFVVFLVFLGFFEKRAVPLIWKSALQFLLTF